ncbi:membrane protein [Nitrincola sp. A-D6]|uniref:TMEM165/GDT1 family protein n=1 Tax=Nitrincola sp. A-D6 TaxID=1545442 RepID=UPI00051FF289|nr:TMEM165/GDT1 family protein [Nitrincola sp. A-D6]KGK42196.1 membrane protein [Nitrincola sp. A-D6]
MDAFLLSTLAVTIAEMGDKTQLLSLLLVAKFRRPWAITLGVALATLLNHGLTAALGDWLGGYLSGDLFQWLLSLSFLAMAVWVLIPDSDDDLNGRLVKYGAFVTTLVLFSLAEIGDKTQVATLMLAVKFESLVLVTLGTTLGMLIANVPVIFAGEWVLKRVNMSVFRVAAAVLFAGFGLWGIGNLLI